LSCNIYPFPQVPPEPDSDDEEEESVKPVDMTETYQIFGAFICALKKKKPTS